MKKQLNYFLDRMRKPKVQLSIVIGVIFYLVGILWWQHNYSFYADPVPVVSEVEQKVSRLASHVTTGLHINTFPEFSFYKNRFIIDAIVWFKYPIGAESLKTVESFSFQNGKILSKSPPIIRVHKGIVTVSYQTTIEVKTILDYQNFPIGDHRLSIILENRRVTPNELCFESTADGLELSKDLLVSTWMPEKKRVKAGAIRSRLNENDASLDINYPCVAFTIDFANQSIRDLMSLYFPIFILFFISFFALLIDIREDGQRMTLMTGAMTTLVLFRLVIDNIAPTASRITKVDHLYFIMVFLSLVMIFFQVYILLSRRLLIKDKSQAAAKTLNTHLELVNSAIFIFVITTLLWTFTYTHMI